jgi:glycerol kinase
MTTSAALDLGSTIIKAALLDAEGAMGEPLSIPAPPLRGSGGIREGDADAYAAAAEELLAELVRLCPPGTPLGIAAQRSTFLLWTSDGSPLTPLISWQDRRAAEWCARNVDKEEEVIRRTGLVLSAHYAGPKLAVTPERSSDALFGTIESYLLWRWSGRRVHETDLTMAARTAMLDLETGGWSPELLALYDVSRGCLPHIQQTSGRSIALGNGLRVTATVADQAAGALAMMAEGDDCAVVNLGTGAFVLKQAGEPVERIAGYLTAPILGSSSGGDRYVLEASINGAGNAVDRYGRRRSTLPEEDPAPNAFCLPDAAGLGAPYWRADIGLALSHEAAVLDPAGRRRTVLEGILFRIRQVLEGLSPAGRTRRLLLSGGLSREPFIAAGLAALLDRSVERLELAEGALLGAARLAAGLDPYADPVTTAVDPGSAGAYLRPKYGRWRRWLDDYLTAS